MKIFTVSLTREADAYTIQNEPIADIDLMERASRMCSEWLHGNIPEDWPVNLFCGTGNNGGDGLAIARMLHESGHPVRVFIAGPMEKMTPSCLNNLRRLPLKPAFLEGNPAILPALRNHEVAIDALIGSGLSKPAEGFVADVIHHINRGDSMIVSIDVPSGLLCDETMRSFHQPTVIKADITLTFAPPKAAFFFPENGQYTGDWHLLDIGIHQAYIEEAEVSDFMITRNDIQSFLHHRLKFAHKGNFGHALLLCGSFGKSGAAVLAAKACLRSGTGLVTVRVPACGVTVLQSAVPEAMVSPDPGEHCLTGFPDLIAFSAIGAGPGTGTDERTASMLKLLIQEYQRPIVFDADAINLLANNKTWLGFIPRGSIFTPHFREFERLTRRAEDDFDRNRLQREFSLRFGCFVVLKGAHTAVTTPDGRCFFNTTGNPGMATGGSGDVLTGIITGLLAQEYTPLEACLLGVYLHGMAGDMAFEANGAEALIAGDIIDNIGKAFKSLYGKL